MHGDVHCPEPRKAFRVLRMLARGAVNDIIEGFESLGASYTALRYAAERVSKLIGARVGAADGERVVAALLEAARLLYATRVRLYLVLEDALNAPIEPPYDDIIEEWPGAELYILAATLLKLYKSASIALEESDAAALLRGVAQLLEAYARVARSTRDAIEIPCYGRVNIDTVQTAREEAEKLLAMLRRPLSDRKLGEGIRAVLGG